MAKRKSKPKPPADNVNDVQLGLLKFTRRLNPEMDEYEGNVVMEGRGVVLSIYTDDTLDSKPAIKRARDLVRKHAAIMKRAEKYLAHNFLPNYNKAMREYSESDVSCDELLEHMKLSFLCVHADGKASYGFDVGNLLSGHALTLYLDENTEFEHVDTPG